MHGYQNASSFLRLNRDITNLTGTSNQDWSVIADGDSESTVVKKLFQLEFEKMVCLDYVIRNTDRGLDNWMVKVDYVDAVTDKPASPVSADLVNVTPDVKLQTTTRKPRVRIAAIDNGLAFPFKHPDSWRSYPYAWHLLPCAEVPFSLSLRNQLLTLLTNREWWE